MSDPTLAHIVFRGEPMVCRACVREVSEEIDDLAKPDWQPKNRDETHSRTVSAWVEAFGGYCATLLAPDEKTPVPLDLGPWRDRPASVRIQIKVQCIAERIYSGPSDFDRPPLSP